MFALSLRYAGHVRHYSICSDSAGWEVKLEEDRTVRRLSHYQDWHRVERAKALFEREVMELTQRGWRLEGQRARRDSSSGAVRAKTPR
jgi:hypothetical protein